ncbi:MAG: hypothetical protein AAGE52_38235 [Myxococcota bacterium]
MRAFELRAALVAVTLLGCGDDFLASSFLDRARVIGAELSVVGAEERPIPGAGESVDIRWVVGRPDDTPATWAFAACESLPSPAGRPICRETPFAFAMSEAPSAEDPRILLDIPADIADDSGILTLGVFCAEGVPQVEALTDPSQLDADLVCSEGLGQVLTQSIGVQRDTDNRNPSWPDDAILLEGNVWAEGDCPEVAVAAEVEITFADLPDEFRETFVRTTNDIPPRELEIRENLILSHLATDGDLSRQFSADDGESEIRPVEWEAPEELPAETRVRFYFGMRDQRGGADFVTRELCVVP